MIFKNTSRNIIRNLLKAQRFKIATFNSGEFFITENNQKIPHFQNVVYSYPQSLYKPSLNEFEKKYENKKDYDKNLFNELFYVGIRYHRTNDLYILQNIYNKMGDEKQKSKDQVFDEILLFAKYCLQKQYQKELDFRNCKIPKKLSNDEIIKQLFKFQDIKENYIRGIYVFNLIQSSKQILKDKKISNYYLKQFFLDMDLFMVCNLLSLNPEMLENEIWCDYVQNILGLNMNQLEHLTFNILVEIFIKQEPLIKSKLIMKFLQQINAKKLLLNSSQLSNVLLLMMKSNYQNETLLKMLLEKVQNKQQEVCVVIGQISQKYFYNLDIDFAEFDISQIQNELLLYVLLSDFKYQNQSSSQKICDFLKKQNLSKDLIIEWVAKAMYFKNKNFSQQQLNNNQLENTFFELVKQNHQNYDEKEKDFLNNASIVIWNKQVF